MRAPRRERRRRLVVSLSRLQKPRSPQQLRWLRCVRPLFFRTIVKSRGDRWGRNWRLGSSCAWSSASVETLVMPPPPQKTNSRGGTPGKFRRRCRQSAPPPPPSPARPTTCALASASWRTLTMQRGARCGPMCPRPRSARQPSNLQSPSHPPIVEGSGGALGSSMHGGWGSPSQGGRGVKVTCV